MTFILFKMRLLFSFFIIFVHRNKWIVYGISNNQYVIVMIANKMHKEDEFIYWLCEYLKHEKLPGLDAHKKMAPEGRFDDLNGLGANSGGVKSAVLLLLYKENMDFHVVFIKRATYNGHHSGQIAFPGGKYETMDKNLIETALREANEEIGVSKQSIQIIGALSDIYIPHSNYLVSPYVGYTNSLPQYTINKGEVEQIITISLSKFMDYNCQSTMHFEIRENMVNAPCWIINNTCIWGATAMIMAEFLEIFKIYRCGNQ